MHVGVVLRSVGEGGTDIDREWIDIKLNEFDDHALEESILLKEGIGATVTASALDVGGVDRALQSALACEANRAVKIGKHSGGTFSSRAAAPLIAAAARKPGVDLILTSVQTPEDLFGQLVPHLGAVLDWPHVSAVNGVRADGADIIVQQEFSGGVSMTLRLALPAVVGVQTASQPLRYVSGTKLFQAIGEKIATLDVEASPGSSEAELLRLVLPDQSSGAVILEGDAETVAEKLHGCLSSVAW